MSTAIYLKTLSADDVKRYQAALQTYLSRKRDMKLAGAALMSIVIDEFGVPPQRAVRMEPSSFIAGILASAGLPTPEFEDPK